MFVQERGQKIEEKMRALEKQKLAEMEEYLTKGIEDATLLVYLFTDTVDEEFTIYSDAWYLVCNKKTWVELIGLLGVSSTAGTLGPVDPYSLCH